MTRQSSPSTHPGFFGVNLTEAYVLGSDGNLWLENAPWGRTPPPRQKVGGGLAAFSPISGTNQVLVLSTDGKLSLNTLGQSANGPQIDENVAAFDGNVTLGVQQAYVLGTDGNLWFVRGPWGTAPPPRQQVDGNVKAFQTIDANQVFVLGTDGTLWLETGPWGTVPPSRIEIGGGGILAFQALGSAPGAEVFVLRDDDTLWLNTVGGGAAGQQVGGDAANIADFVVAPGTKNQVYVLSSNGTVWLNTVGQGASAPQIDANAVAFDAYDSDHIYVLGGDGNLWLEQGPWGKVPPSRQLVDGNVMQTHTWAMTGLQMQYQLMSNWCWIAVATSISRFYNPASTWTQCSLATAQLQASASLHMQGQCCPDAQLVASTNGLAAALANPYSSTSLSALNSVNSRLAATPIAICNHTGDVGKALTQTGNLNGSEMGSTVPATDLLNELRAGHSVSISIQWAGGGSHEIAASGVELPGTVIIEDPIYGRSILPYQTVASSYQGNGSWTNTCHTKP
jgi:hypothetical protein